jgi:hypothetical protein
MTGDCHVRFRESRGVRFPPATRLIGAFYRDLLSLAYAAYAGVARRERPARWTLATEAPTHVAMHRAALCMPYAVALLSPESGP